ncbi:hypothetical protein JQN72_17365 [Phycicoccus sp. CSK15P-2]|uniref:DUF6603 domain-containing protein n=1 Tax=Phycicoccus sp. CSK15P-2 TaxID=2807627 RepID=UPI0019502774|nr:DUF6603 domain-containing protein [Phycicoccus sp. CSK15P-2]MBM6406015.1 hypothetical protein [Phycicoccus sp. CSK15P-2]
MTTTPGALEATARFVAEALYILGSRLDGAAVDDLARHLGHELPDEIAFRNDVSSAAQELSDAATALLPGIIDLVEAGEAGDATALLAAGADLLAANRSVFDTVDALAEALDAARAELDADQAEQAQQLTATFARRVVEQLVVERLAYEAPVTTAILGVIGLVDQEEIVDHPTQPWHIRRALHLDRLPVLLSDPARYGREVHGWGTTEFDGVDLLERVQQLLRAVGLLSTLIVPPEPDPAVLEATLFSLAVDPDAAPPGLLASLRVAGSGLEHTEPFAGPWRFELGTTAEFDSGVEVAITPPMGMTLHPPGPASAELAITARLVGERDDGPVVLLSVGNLAQLVARRVTASLEVAGSWSAGSRVTASPAVELRLEGAGLAASGSDAFVRSLAQDNAVNGEFDLTLRWSPEQGLSLRGSAGLAARIPIGSSALPFLDVDAVDLAVGLDEDSVQVQAGLEVAARLGPLRANVLGMGLGARLSFPEHGGNLGPVDLTVDVVPPEGVGLSPASGPLRGGGFLDHDPDTGEYSGVLQLAAAKLVFSAVGLVSTRRPSGGPGFSMVLLLTGEFRPAIRLGYGFSLNRIGGLVGINRSADMAALRTGARTGALDSVMFPGRAVDDAPQVLSGLRSYFPERTGSHLLGPMVQLGWGPVPVLRADLALVLEMPEPLRLAVVGRVRMGLPSLRTPLGRFNLDVVGLVDLDAGTLAVDAQLFNSRIGAVLIDGQAAVRARWRRDPDFALSIGGFHPRFRPPPGFPALRRVTLNLTRGDNPRVRLTGYLAMTPNSVQFGARVEAYASWRNFSVEGHLAFDTLFRFTPFRFVVDISAGAAVKRSGKNLLSVTLKLRVSGPKPWSVSGSAKFRVVVKITIPVNYTSGGGQFPSIQRVDLRALLATELARPESWSGQLPPADGSAVTLRDAGTEPDVVLVHPQGRLEVRQTLLPLNTRIDKHGEQAPSGPRRFVIDEVLLGGGVVEHTAVRDLFAPAQYLDMTDTQRLTSPAFRSYQSGVAIRPGGATDGDRVTMRPHYEEVVVDVEPRTDGGDPSGVALARAATRTGERRRQPVAAASLGTAHRRTVLAAASGFRARVAAQPAPRRVLGEEPLDPVTVSR